MKNLILVFWICLICGCATTKPTIAPNLQLIDIPPLGAAQTVELGDTLVAKGKIYTFEAIRLQNNVSAGDGVFTYKFALAPGTLVATMKDDEWIYYSADRLEVSMLGEGTQIQSGGLAINLTDPNDIKFFWHGGQTASTPKPTPIIVKTTTTAANEPSFKQELIYNGRSGDTLKFLYREFSNEDLRAPFSQEVQYDLKDSLTIGFKGARIEVIKASNTALTYRVLSNFPDAQ